MISLPAIAAAGSIGSSLFGMLGGGGNTNASNVNLPPQFQMPNMGGAAGGAFEGIGGLGAYNNYAQMMPQAADTTNRMFNNPYSGQAQGGANYASDLGMHAAGNTSGYGDLMARLGIGAGGRIAGIGQQAGQQYAQQGQQGGGYLQGQGQSLVPYAQQIMQTGFDPQNALHDRTQQQLQDQVRVGQSVRGIATTPYGAGMENQAMSNFDIDWQNNQLNRQTQAGQAGGNLINTGASIYGTGTGMGMQGTQGGANLATGGLQTGANTAFAGLQGGAGLLGQSPNLAFQSAQYPYATYMGQGQNQMGALQGYGAFGAAASSLPQQQIQDYLAYIGAGNSAGGVANQTAQLGLNQAQLGFNQNQQLGANMGAGMYGLGNAYTKMQYPGAQPMPLSAGNYGGTGGGFGGYT